MEQKSASGPGLLVKSSSVWIPLTGQSVMWWGELANILNWRQSRCRVPVPVPDLVTYIGVWFSRLGYCHFAWKVIQTLYRCFDARMGVRQATKHYLWFVHSFMEVIVAILASYGSGFTWNTLFPTVKYGPLWAVKQSNATKSALHNILSHKLVLGARVFFRFSLLFSHFWAFVYGDEHRLDLQYVNALATSVMS